MDRARLVPRNNVNTMNTAIFTPNVNANVDLYRGFVVPWLKRVSKITVDTMAARRALTRKALGAVLICIVGY
jgi:hypothetical protein